MPPRRTPARRQGADEAGQSSSSSTDSTILSGMEETAAQLSGALSTFDSVESQDLVKTLLTSQVESSEDGASSLLSLPLSHTLITVLRAPLETAAVVGLIRAVVEEWQDEKKAVLWESLVDAVEVLEVEREDTQDMQQQQEGDIRKSPGTGGGTGIQVIKQLIDDGDLPAHIPNLLLSPNLLLILGLHPFPHNVNALQRSHIKRNTTLFYKQSKYNLLRESSEGFSALIVLLTSPLALSDDVATESEAKRNRRAEQVWLTATGLIGYFNLSPPRVLDLILEVASCHVAVHWRFWLAVLRRSPWGGRANDKARMHGDKGKGKEKAGGVDSVLDWDGDRVLSQVLGVKFGFHQKPDGGDTSMGLIYVAALLIKFGFIGLADLLPFLSPDDAEMSNIHGRWLKSISSRSGPSNALANSVLMDEDESASTTAKESDATSAPPKPPPEQRIQLLQALLAIGEISSAQYFLAKFPWTAQSHPQISDLILRMVATQVEGLYRKTVPGMEGLEPDLGLTAPASGLPLVDKEIVPTLFAPSPPETPTTIFKFFFPGWRDDLVTWNNWEEMYREGLPWLALVRGHGGRASAIMVKICRIGFMHFATLRRAKEAAAGMLHGAKTRDEMRLVEPTVEEMEPWLNILRIALLPALSASGSTAAFDIDIWALLRFFPYTVRYQLYGEWRDFTCTFNKSSTCPIAGQAAAECTREIKKALSRVTASQSTSGSSASTAADRGPARALAKLSHSNPCALWTTAVTQVKAYPNIGASIVDAGRYMTQLSMDVATFTLVDVLSDEGISRLNPQGTEVAQWLENIATFVGDFNRRYAMMDLEPILQFIINRLMRGNADDLTILSRLIQRMYGVDTVENNGVSDAQLEAYATGREMVHEAFWATRILAARPSEDPTSKPKEAPLDKAKSTKKSLPRLISALRDTRLALPIWIALAQTRQGVVDKLAIKDAPLKAMGIMQDKVHDSFIQYGDLLSEQLSADEHISLVPDFAALTSDFGLDFPMAFEILRRRLNAEIEKVKSQNRDAVQKRLEAEKDALNGKSATPSERGSPITPTTPLPAEGADVDMDGVLAKEEGANGDKTNGHSVPGPKAVSDRPWWPSALTTTIEQAHQYLPPAVHDVMTPAFFVIFWHLSISDIAFSAQTYTSAIDRITAQEKDVASWRTPNVTEQKAERTRLRARIEVLVKERDAQSAFVNGTMRRRLRSEASKWFGQSITEKGTQRAFSLQLHQYCFFPRALLTPSDAVFVPKFIRLIHDLGADGFSTVFAYNNFFGDHLAACIFSCTESEARNLARCLKAILVDMDIWHNDEARFKREAWGLPDTPTEGQTPEPLPGMRFRAKVGQPVRLMSWQEFRNFNAKLHLQLCKALVTCWAETDFMHIKNGITVALQVLPVFPLVDTHGQSIEKAIDALRGEKSDALTPDLQQGCAGYATQLKKRIRDGRGYVTTAVFQGAAQRASAASAKTAPAAPRQVSQPNGDAAKETNGTSSPAPKSTSIADQEALRQRVLETRATKAASSAAVSAKDERKSVPPPSTEGVTDSPATLTEAEKDKAKTQTSTPPAGPRATRASASVPPSAPSGPANGSRANGTANPNAPTGPSRGIPNLPQKPGSTPASTPTTEPMGPPRALTLEEERAAARARKFGPILPQSSPARVPSGPSASTQAISSSQGSATLSATQKSDPAPKSEAADSSSATVASPSRSRRSSPNSGAAVPGRARRSGSVDSRTSERSRRSRREQEDRDRDLERSRRRQAETSGPRNPAESDIDARKRQEDLLQARHDKLAEGDKRDERRGSSGGHRRERETDKERQDRKAKEKEDKDKGKEDSRPDDGGRRKRDEEPRRIDPIERPGDRRREQEERERERDRDRDRDRDSHRRRERDRDDDARRGSRHDERDRDRERSKRDGTRRHRSRDRDLRRTPESRDTRATRSSADRGDGDRTPRADASAPAPARPAPASAPGAERVVEAPANARPAESNNGNGAMNNRAQHALPARPGGAGAPSNGVAPSGPSLADRMGPALGIRVSSDALAPGAADPRKRPLDENVTPAREESPGAAKRVKIDREKARGHDRKGREGGGGEGGGGGNRLLAGAMRATHDK